MVKPMAQFYTIKKNKIVNFLFCSWLGLWSANVVQDIVIWASGTSEKIWVLDVDSENSIYTWFSTLLLGLAALIAFSLASHKAEQNNTFRKQWVIVGIILLIMSMDEMLSFHEHLSGLLRRALSTSGVFTFAWVIPAIFIVVIIGLMFWPFMRSLPSHIARGIFLAGAVFVTGAIGMEMVAGLYISESGTRDAFRSPIYRFLTSIEEGLEVIGVIILIRTLLMQAELYFPPLFKAAEQPTQKPSVQARYHVNAKEGG